MEANVGAAPPVPGHTVRYPHRLLTRRCGSGAGGLRTSLFALEFWLRGFAPETGLRNGGAANAVRDAAR